jgi:hypothetical protein
VTEQELTPGDETTVTISLDVSEEVDLDVFERFETELGTASFESASVDGDSVSPSFVDLEDGGGIILFDGIGSGSVTVEYSLSVAPDAADGVYSFEPDLLDIDGQAVSIDGIGQIEVGS